MKRSETDILRALADCEQRLAQIEKENKELGLPLAKTIKHNVECSRQTIQLCLEKMADKDFAQAEVLADITWLRTNFAVQSFEAERTEALVGEAEFLSLSNDWNVIADEALREIALAVETLAIVNQSTKCTDA